MKVIINSVAILFFFSLNLQSSSANFNTEITSDSMLYRIEQAEGEEKLKLLYQHSVSYENTKRLIDIANWMEKEALKQNNIKYLSLSYLQKSRYFLFNNDLDSLLHYTDLVNNLSDSDDSVDSFMSSYYIATMYISKGYYELATHNLSNLLNKWRGNEKKEAVIYELLGTAYLASERYTPAKDNFLKSIKIIDLFPDKPIGYLSVYPGLITSLTYLKKYDEALDACIKIENIIKQNTDKIEPPTINVFMYKLYLLYADIYIEKKQAEMAYTYINKAQGIIREENHDTFKYDINIVKSAYYYLIEDYTKSLDYIEPVFTFYEGVNSDKRLMNRLIKHKINILEQQNRYSEALFLQGVFMNKKDSIYQENIPWQLAQLSKKYELEKVKVEQLKDKAQLEKARSINVSLAIAIVSLCAIIYIIRLSMRKLKVKNKVLYKQSAEVNKYIAFIKEHYSTKEEELANKRTTLYDQLEIWMQEYEEYKKADLTREDVAKALNTNRQYVADAIKEGSGKTFMDYINDYRLEYARNQLISDETIPVGNIIQDSGFLSNATFYRLFKDKFGMTPNELRRVKSEIESDILNL